LIEQTPQQKMTT